MNTPIPRVQSTAFLGDLMTLALAVAIAWLLIAPTWI